MQWFTPLMMLKIATVCMFALAVITTNLRVQLKGNRFRPALMDVVFAWFCAFALPIVVLAIKSGGMVK